MNYNLFIKYGMGGFNILDIASEKLPIIVNAYKNGDYKFTISGSEYNWGDLKILKIFRNESSLNSKDIANYCQERGGWINVFGAGALVSPEFLENLGSEVTNEFLEDVPFGGHKQKVDRNEAFISQERIYFLLKINSKEFDLSKLITICNELNANWMNGNYYTVGLLLRTIINHIPPVFGNSYTSFAHVIANYGSQSFKKIWIT